MNWPTFGFLALAVALVANLCSAAVFERDWKMPGDGLLTYDDVNQRAWLDLSVSRLNQFEGEDLSEQYQSALLEFAPAGLLNGFVGAKRSDVVALGLSAGVNTMTLGFETNQATTENLIHLLGITFRMGLSNESFWSTGLLDEWTPPPVSFPLSAIFEVEMPRPFNAGRAGLRTGVLDGSEYNNLGLFLYRPVPEPAIAILLLSTGPSLLLRPAFRLRR
jgi:hypothetical protein